MFSGGLFRNTRYSAKLRDLDFSWLLSSVGVLGARVDLQLPVHRITHLGLRQHAANRFLHETNRPALPDVNRALLAQAALEAAVTPIHLVRFLLSRQLHRLRVHDDDVVARVNERGVGGLVLALKQPGRQGGHTAEDLVLRIDDMPPAVRALRAGYERTHVKGPSGASGQTCPGTANPNDTEGCRNSQPDGYRKSVVCRELSPHHPNLWRLRDVADWYSR